MKAVARLLPIIAQHRRLFVETILWSTVVQAGLLTIALGLAMVVGRAITGSGEHLAGAAAALVALCLFVAAATWRESWVSHDLAYRLIGVLRGRVFASARHALPPRRRQKRTGDLVSTLVSDIETLEWLYAHTVAQTVSATLILAVAGAVSITIDPLLLAVWAPLLLVGVLVPLGTSRMARRYGDAIASRSAGIRSELLDTIRGLRDLRAADALDLRRERISADVRELARIQVKDASRLGLERGIADLIFAAAAIGAIGIAVMAGSELEPSQVPLAVAVSVAGLGPAAQILDLLRGAGVLRASAERIVETLDEPPSVDDSHRYVRTGARADEEGLVLENVRFAYRESAPVLDGFDLEVRPGETVALVGPSGAGKTSVARLALRLWDPDGGTVRVDGTDVRTLPDSDLRRLVSAVPQSSPLLRGTIRSNIALGDPAANDAAVHRAAETAGLLSDSAGLPGGLDTTVGEYGAGLSGGQRARVAIARAVLREPRVLVLDEATASLDPDADAAVLELLQRSRCAILLVSHRPATIAAADRVVRLPG